MIVWLVIAFILFVCGWAIFRMGVICGREEQRKAMTLPEGVASRYRDVEPRWR